jgi:hypothetical protein
MQKNFLSDPGKDGKHKKPQAFLRLFPVVVVMVRSQFDDLLEKLNSCSV